MVGADREERVSFHVRLTPNAARTAIGAWEIGPDGKAVLRATVTVVPEKSKANEALIKLLSKSWGIPKSAFRIERGDTDRNKILSVPATFADALSAAGVSTPDPLIS